MPELPEVETTRRGIAPHVLGRRVRAVVVREPRLRWPVAPELAAQVGRRVITGVHRRGKYLLLETRAGALILHLGMSGSLRVVPAAAPPGPHDHVDIVLAGGYSLRLRDPRRFGSLLWSADPALHPLLAGLGPEPFDPAFSGAYLHRRARGRRQAVKSMLMDPRVVAGIGNIYATEALFSAGIHPARPAGRIAAARYARLARAVVEVLEDAIRAGGTTLRDFIAGDGRPGYFRASLRVYGRAGLPCPRCHTPIRRIVVGQRSSFHCPGCQR